MSKHFFLIGVAAMALVDIALVYQGIVHGIHDMAAENNVLENAQAFILLLSMLVFLYGIVDAEKGSRGVLFAGALACLSFFLSEVDVEDFELPQVIVFLGSGPGRNAILGSLWLLVFVDIFRRFAYYRQVFSRLMRATPGLLLFMAGGVLLIGRFFEENMLGLALYQFYEELAEMNAYGMVLLAAFATPEVLRGVPAIRPNSPTPPAPQSNTPAYNPPPSRPA